jgi:hypothetical protein
MVASPGDGFSSFIVISFAMCMWPKGHSLCALYLKQTEKIREEQKIFSNYFKELS